MKRAYLSILVMLLVACLAPAAIAEPNGWPGHGRKGPGMQKGRPGRAAGPGVWMILRMKERLALTDTQIEQLEAIKTEVQPQLKAGAEAVKAKRDALQEAVKSGADEAAIRAAATELGNALGDQAVLKVKSKAQIDKILTDEQKAKLNELKEQRRKGEGVTTEGTKTRKGLGRAADPEAAFARIDSNGDGSISLDEFKAYRAQMKERFSHRGPRGPHGPWAEHPAEEPQE